MKSTQPQLLVAVCLIACNGGSLTDATTTTDSALTTAQCTYQGFDASVKACFDTFKTCLANTEEATQADCDAALKACLPAPPQRPAGEDGGDMKGGCGGDGHGGPGGPGGQGGPGHGGPPPKLDDGGFPPPPGGGPMPDPVAVQQCHDDAMACVTAGGDQATCGATEHACVRAAFQAAFQAACEASGNTSGKCAEGVDGMPPAPDGGSQCSGS